MSEKRKTRYSLDKKLNTLTDRDYEALNNIYRYRCLSFDQIFELSYKYSAKDNSINTQEYAKKKVKLFLELELIEEVNVFNKEVPNLFQLTRKSIERLKEYYMWPETIYDEKKRVQIRSYLTEGELNVKERFMAHQYNLNKFVLKLKDYYKEEFSVYEDEKHIQSFFGIRPDGIFTLGNITYFLEMDMGTENAKQLREKWDHYRTFLNSNEFIFRERKIVILFIVEGVASIEKRISLIKDTINAHFIDCFSKDIDMYVNTPDKLIESIKERIDKEIKCSYSSNDSIYNKFLNKGFTGNNNEEELKKLFKEHFSFLLRKDINNKNYDYLFIDAKYEPLKSLYIESYNEPLLMNYKKDVNDKIRTIAVVDDLETAYRDLLIFGLHDLLFATLKDLEEKDLEEAVKLIDKEGNVFHFETEKLEKIVPEGIIKLNKKQKNKKEKTKK